MSRHRNVRGMDYGEDYEGYDDVYGHSVEDDCGVSPSTADQFIFHRSLQHHQLASFLEEGEEDLKKEEQADSERARKDSDRSLGDSNNFQKPQLSDIEEAQLQSCLEEIRNVVGETVPEHMLIETALAHKFNFEKALNYILDQYESTGAGGPKNNNNTETLTGVCDLSSERKAARPKSAVICGEFSDGESVEPVPGDPIGFSSTQESNRDPLSSCARSREISPQRSSPKVSNIPLADLVQSHQVSKPQASLSSLSAPFKPSAGVPSVPSMPLSALASAHLSSPLSANVAVQGQGSPSLSQLAGSHLGAVGGTPEARLLPVLPLSGLSERSLSSTPPRQFPERENTPARSGTTGGQMVPPRASLSDLAHGHLSSDPPGFQPLPSQEFSRGYPSTAPRPSSLGASSAAGSAAPHLSSNPHGRGLAFTGCPGGSSQGTAGVSLSDLATGHLSSPAPLRPVAQMSAVDSGHLPAVSHLAGASLSSLATAHLSSAPQLQAIADPPGVKRSALDSGHLDRTSLGTTKVAGTSLSSLATAHLSQSTDAQSAHILPGCRTVAPSSGATWQAATSSLTPGKVGVKGGKGSHEHIPPAARHADRATCNPAGAADTAQNAEQALDSQLTSPQRWEPSPHRVPPGFTPVEHQISPSSEQEVEERKRVPTPPGFHSRTAPSTKDGSSSTDLPTSLNRDAAYSRDLGETEAHPKRNRRCLLANPSVFGRALCSEHTDQSRELSHRRGAKLTSYVYQKQHSRPTVHRQFSYQRQKSWTTGRTDDGEEIVPFDFSSPSPDDIIRQRQAGAFGASSQPPPRQPSPGRPQQALPVAAASNEAAVAAVTPEVARLSMPSKEARKGFQLGPVPSQANDKRRKSAVAKSKPDANFLDGLTEGNLKSEPQGKLPMVMSAPDLVAMAGSTTPLPGTIASQRRESKTSKFGTIDIAKEYSKRQEGKQLINLVVIGHVDAGKSTLMGHLLYLLGQVNQRQMHKYEQESKKVGKASFAFAWVLDETGEERQRGITMDVGLTNFETPNRTVTLLDAPGHKDFIPNMITGAAQADVAILVVDATRGEFETGFDSGGQTREHAILVRSLGVTQLAVAINKLDTVGWSEGRFVEIVGKLGQFLKQAGFKDSDVQYIPCSGLTGENLRDKATEPALTEWYKGPTLMERIDTLKAPKRPIEKPFRQCVSDVFKGMGAGISIAGKIESGGVQVGDKVVIMPAAEYGQVRGVSIHEEETKWACAGDHATVVVTGIDQVNIGIGSIMCCIEHPIPTATLFRARVIMFNLDVPVTKGFPVLLHYQTVSEPANICKLVSTLHKSTGEVLQKRPKCLTKQSNAIIDIETSRPVCLELYKDFKDLGRFMLRYGGSTIGAGVVTEIKR